MLRCQYEFFNDFSLFFGGAMVFFSFFFLFLHRQFTIHFFVLNYEKHDIEIQGPCSGDWIYDWSIEVTH